MPHNKVRRPGAQVTCANVKSQILNVFRLAGTLSKSNTSNKEWQNNTTCWSIEQVT